MKLRTFIHLGVGLLVVVLSATWILQRVSIDEVWQSVQQMNLLLVLMSVPVVLLSHVVRAWRWQLILGTGMKTTQVTHAFSAVMIGYAANSIIPRSGEALRPYVYAIRTESSTAAAIASVFFERIVDVLTLVTAIVFVSAIDAEVYTSLLPGSASETVLMNVVLPIASVGVILGVLVLTTRGSQALVRIARFAGTRVERVVASLIRSVRSGMSGVKKPRTIAFLALSTTFMWFLYIVPLWLLAHATPEPSPIAPNLYNVGLMLIVISVGVTIAPTPAAFGVYQSFCMAAYSAILQGTSSQGAALAMVAWIVNYGVAFLVGLISWFAESRSGKTISFLRKPPTQQTTTITEP